MTSAGRYKVVCIDLDGTLLPETSVSLWLAQHTGHGHALEELEDRFRTGEISNAVIAEATAGWLTGLRRQDLWTHLARARWIDGIQTTIDTLKAHGHVVLLGTITWTVAAEYPATRHGFDAYCGTEPEMRDNRLTGRVARHFDEYDKLRFVTDYCRTHDIDPTDCVAIGDSRSDIPLFGQVGLAVALNGTAAARQAAHTCVDGYDLTAVLPHILDPAR